MRRALKKIVVFLVAPVFIAVVFFFILFRITESPLSSFCKQYAEAELRDIGECFQYTDIPNLYFVPKPKVCHFNSLGMNDIEYPPEKDSNTFRIMILGDSVAEMEDFVDDDRENFYHEILEKSLNGKTAAKRFEVWNLGVRKYNTIQEYVYFKEMFLKYGPDLVLVGYIENNDYDPPRLIYNEKYSMEKNCILATIPRMIAALPDGAHEKLCDYSAYRFANWAGYRIMSAVNPVKYPRLNFFRDTRSLEIVEGNRKALMDMKELSQRHRFGLVIVIFPFLYHENNRDPWLMNTVKKEFNAVDLYGVFMSGKYDPMELRSRPDDPIHPNVLGHRLAAEAIEEYLTEGKYVP